MVQNLKRLREKHGISQQRLAAAIGVSQQSVNKYENHNIEPDIRTLIAMADYFHISVDYLIGRTDEAAESDSTTPCILNKDELQLISQYRDLSLKEQKSILLIMENYRR